jgi:hypothetical protein
MDHKQLEILRIEGTGKTPSVIMDPSGIIKIQGRSIPEDASLFFEKILDWLDKYTHAGRRNTRVDLSLEYLNSGTSKYMLEILKHLKDFSLKGSDVVINWFYESGDDDIQERGEYYSSILDLKINLIETE